MAQSFRERARAPSQLPISGESDHPSKSRASPAQQTVETEPEAMNLEDHKMLEELAKASNRPVHVVFLEALERSKWKGDKAHSIAHEARRLMKTSGLWRPSYKGRNWVKKNDQARCRRILVFLGEKAQEPGAI